MNLFTIGFTKTTAEDFFSRLRLAGVRSVIDTRINRDGQLSGFAKATDLEYFLRTLNSATYSWEPSLAPTPELLQQYRNKIITWPEYEQAYLRLLKDRKVERNISPSALDQACLLCSEATPNRCHRRLASDYLQTAFSSSHTINIRHL